MKGQNYRIEFCEDLVYIPDPFGIDFQNRQIAEAYVISSKRPLKLFLVEYEIKDGKITQKHTKILERNR